MEEIGVDYLHVASSIYGLDGYRYLDVSPVYASSGEVIELAKSIKSEVSIPVIGGGGVNDPLFAEEVLKQRKVDLIALGRTLLADPNWPLKVKKGKVEEIVPCIRCNRCHQRLFSGKEVRCTVNPLLGKGRKCRVRKVDRAKNCGSWQWTGWFRGSPYSR